MDVTTWLDQYRRAWITGDSRAAASLFTPDAAYRSFAFNDPHVGHEGIAAYWDIATADQADVQVDFGQPIEQGDRVAVEWWTTMRTDDDGPVTLVGALVLSFRHGRCHDLREYWHLEPGHQAPPAGWGV